MKEKISSLTSSTISALRFPLTVGVVFIHFNVLSDNLAMRGTGNAEHFPTWLVCMFNLFSEVLPRIAVPLFFIISGYLFFRSGFMIRTYTDKLRRRVRTLLVPYILWNLLYLIRTAFRDIPAFSGLSHDTAQANWSLSAVLACSLYLHRHTFIRRIFPCGMFATLWSWSYWLLYSIGCSKRLDGWQLWFWVWFGLPCIPFAI